MHAWCCGGRGGAATDPVDRGLSLRGVTVAMRPGCRGDASCSQCARIRFSGHIDLFGWWFVVMCENVGICL